jgi:hypothetical protein
MLSAVRIKVGVQGQGTEVGVDNKRLWQVMKVKGILNQSHPYKVVASHEQG